MTKRKREVAALERSMKPLSPATAIADEAQTDTTIDLLGVGAGRVGLAIAVVEDISPDGVAMVVVAGEERARAASSVLRFSCATAASDALLGRTVLVAVDRAAVPIILGVVAQRLWDTGPDGTDRDAEVSLPRTEPISVEIDKRRLDLEASDEIRLTCGKSSLVLRRDGTVVVRGVKIVSRASQSNKVRGATVSLN